MARLIVIAIIAFLVFVALRGVLAKKKLSVRQFFSIYLATLFGLILLFLAVTGRLPPVFAFLGVVLPFLLRVVPMIMHGARFASIIRSIKASMGGNVGPPPQTSEITSRYIHMVLFHDTGVMDGTVLEGRYQHSKLSRLEREQLEALMEEIRHDSDSASLLSAYLDREHSDWQFGEEQPAAAGSGNDMTESQALDILGLGSDATKEDVIQAHRRLMQKVHPDRGGSTYLASKINAAKDLLTKILD